MSELMTAEQIQNAVGRTALQIGTIADTLGVVTDTIKRHEESIHVFEKKFENVESFMAEQKDKEIIDAHDVANISKCIKNRCIDILKPHDRLDIVGKFMKKCRVDLGDNTHYIGKSGVYTQRIYYQQVLDYIGCWMPEGWGIAGYINHLDELKKQRNQ